MTVTPGRCQFSSETRRRPSQLKKLSLPATCTSSVVLIRHDVALYLCRTHDKSAIYGSDSLSWSRSIQIISKAHTDGLVQDFLQQQIILPFFSIRDVSADAETLPDAEKRFQAKLQPFVSVKNHDFVAGVVMTPIIPLSVILRSGSTKEMPTLQRACIKRQMTGTSFLYDEAALTTQISHDLDNETFYLTVESVTHRQGASSGLFFFVLAPSTRITILEREQIAVPLVEGETNGLNIAELSDTASTLLEAILFASKDRKHLDIPRMFLLTGPPGVGKSFAVKTAIERCPIPILATFLRGSEIAASQDGQSSAAQKLEKHFRSAAKHDGPNLIFLDECDALMSSHGVAAALTVILDTVGLEWKRMVVVAATNRIDAIPPSLRRPGRFERELILQPPSSGRRHEILRSLIGDDARGTDLEDIAEIAIGYVPADLHALVRRAKVLGQNNQNGLMANLRLAMDDVGASALRDASLSKPPKTTWDDVCGDAGGAKTALIQAIEWPRTKRKAFEKLSLTSPRGILLHGPPGCAKTSLARAAAGSENVAFLSLSPADVYASSYVGEAEAIIRRAFATARAAAPCILFFDELDSILGSNPTGEGHQMHRSGGGSSAESRILSTFLNETDGLTSSMQDRVLVIGATNRPATLDAALLRPGRFDRVVYIPPPDREDRRAILEAQLVKTMGLDCSDEVLDGLARDTHHFTGAEIVGACREAATRMIREYLSTGDPVKVWGKIEYVKSALGKIKPLLADESILEQYAEFDRRRRMI